MATNSTNALDRIALVLVIIGASTGASSASRNLTWWQHCLGDQRLSLAASSTHW